ncbi:MAG: hypothetical protein PHU27_03995 [Salinivirgaceae bacterium]|jgi:hypothetical protein|nr:hypothetical protein [Salinivirgaceae bacterium]
MSELQLPQKVVISTPDGLTNWEARLYRVSDTITIFEKSTVRIVLADTVGQFPGNGLNVIIRPTCDTLKVQITSKSQTMINRILSK